MLDRNLRTSKPRDFEKVTRGALSGSVSRGMWLPSTSAKFAHDLTERRTITAPDINLRGVRSSKPRELDFDCPGINLSSPRGSKPVE